MSLTSKNSIFTLFILVVQWCYSYGACPSLFSTEALTVTCRHDNKTLANCENPMEGTEAYLACNMFYEEVTLEANPKRLCREGKWNDIIPQCYPICGKKRIKENFDTEKNQDLFLNHPWHVGIYDVDRFQCEGTLIAMNIVVTVAFFVAFSRSLVVASGKHYIGYDDNRDKLTQYSNVSEVHFPEQYRVRKDNYAYNIAILILSRSLLPSQVVQPICLNFDSSSYNSLLQDNGIVVGWVHRYKDLRTSSMGIKVETVLYIPYSKCFSTINSNDKKYITFDKICGSYLDNGNESIICKFGYGNALVFKNKIDDRYYIAGILGIRPSSMTTTSSSGAVICDRNQYSSYTALSKHRSFLKNWTADIERKNCELPDHPSHGKYVLLNSNGTLVYEFGHLVPTDSRLTLTCNAGYSFTSPGSTQYYCLKNGQWNPALTGCTLMPTSFNYNYAILIVSTIVILVALVAILLYKLKYKKEWELQRKIKLAELRRFHNGNLKGFNRELDIGEQAEFLPYNSNFEFPRDKLKLGKQLGSGAFGVVIQADAFGIITNVEKTVVAVKTLKNTADRIQIKILTSELKIMVHLGQHLNVVNLLGACTKNITNRELLVIVEYCQFGNVYNYLLRNRKNFINQIDDITGNIDYSYGVDDLANELAIPDNLSTSQETESINPIYTKDLVSWSFQVARGMEYLASRKILHGDLAARNILLADHNIVKICDFGLSKRMYQSMNYKKQNDCPLPMKWMAIESIQDRIFSTQSDVWSFGIVL